MWGKRVSILVASLAAMVATPSLASAAQTIRSGGPLTQIYLGDDLGCQVVHTGDTQPEFFGSSLPGACGTFVATGGTTYGPTVPAGPSVTNFTPVAQSAITGNGSAASPFAVTTGATLGSTGLAVAQTDSYVAGTENYLTRISLANTTSGPVSATIFHAGDCFLQNTDSGFGFHDASSGGIFCTANPNNSPAGRILGFRPQTPGSSYQEGGFGSVWSSVGSGTPFPNTCDCTTNEDNGAGLSWNVTVPAGGTSVVSLVSTFSPSGSTSGTPQTPAPVLGRAVNVRPVSGQVLVKLPGTAGFVPLSSASQIPVGSMVDTRKGVVSLVSASGSGGRTYSGNFQSGVFKVGQSRARSQHGLTVLQIVDHPAPGTPSFAGCRSGHAGDLATAARSLPRRTISRLRGSARGRYSTRGRYSSATIHGTVWTVTDRCDGTLTSVSRGSVSVRDFHRRKTIIVRAHHSYLARAR